MAGLQGRYHDPLYNSIIMASGLSYSKEAPSRFPKPGDTPRKVKVIDNEEIHPPKEFILNHTVKTLDQVSDNKVIKFNTNKYIIK